MTHFIRFLSKKEIYKFQNLIKKNWKKKDHIFTKNSKLILFYYNYHNKKITNILLDTLYLFTHACIIMPANPAQNRVFYYFHL